MRLCLVAPAAGGGNAYVADVSAAQLNEFPGFQVAGKRVTRARFPNGNVELPERSQPATWAPLGALDPGNPDGVVLMTGAEADWVPPDHSLIQETVQVYNSDTSQMRNGSFIFGHGKPQLNTSQPIYTTYMGGIGGPCARYDPPFSYWCSSSNAGGKSFSRSFLFHGETSVNIDAAHRVIAVFCWSNQWE